MLEISNVNYGMLYHDMTNRVMVHYVQEEAIDATINTIHEVEEKMNDIDKRLRDGYRTRIVTSQNSLREKALIFKCGLDDRVVELGKLFLIAHAGQQHPDAEFTDVFFNESEGDYYFEFIGLRPDVNRRADVRPWKTPSDVSSYEWRRRGSLLLLAGTELRIQDYV